MSRFANLPTLADQRAKPVAIPKPSTKLDRAIAHKDARLSDAKQLLAWARAVKNRDQWKDRKTGKAVKSTRQLDPDRAESHHIEPKENQATRYDIRNGVCLSFATHFLVTTGKLRIEGSAFFVADDGRTYIDATYDLIFVRT